MKDHCLLIILLPRSQYWKCKHVFTCGPAASAKETGASFVVTGSFHGNFLWQKFFFQKTNLYYSVHCILASYYLLKHSYIFTVFNVSFNFHQMNIIIAVKKHLAGHLPFLCRTVSMSGRLLSGLRLYAHVSISNHTQKQMSTSKTYHAERFTTN